MADELGEAGVNEGVGMCLENELMVFVSLFDKKKLPTRHGKGSLGLKLRTMESRLMDYLYTQKKFVFYFQKHWIFKVLYCKFKMPQYFNLKY